MLLTLISWWFGVDKGSGFIYDVGRKEEDGLSTFDVEWNARAATIEDSYVSALNDTSGR